MKTTVLLSLIFILPISTLAPAATRLVPSQYPTIQQAINDCNSGDTVLVADGTYSPFALNGTFLMNKAITVKSENGPNNCIIDCTAFAGGIVFEGTGNAAWCVDGFTIINESTTIGAIYCSGSNITITNCILTKNTGQAPICCYYGQPTISNCLITGNICRQAGGFLIIKGSNCYVTNCIITNNSATADGGAGGILTDSGSSPRISNCIISNNFSVADTGAGGFYCYSSNPTITNSIISNNSTPATGGAAIFCKTSNPTIINCTIRNNNSAGLIGAIYSEDWFGTSRPIITNSILWDNNYYGRFPVSGQIFGCSPVIRYSCMKGLAYSLDEAGNFGNNPLFEPNNYHLSANSPCINTGKPANEYAGQTDIDSQPRLMGGRVDIGADEFTCDPPILLEITGPKEVMETYSGRYVATAHYGNAFTQDVTILAKWSVQPPSAATIQNGILQPLSIDQTQNVTVYAEYTEGQTAITAEKLVQILLYVPHILLVPQQYPTIQSAIDACYKDVVIVAAGRYTGPGNRDIDFKGKAITVRSTDPNNPNIVAATIIDCNGTVTDPHRGFIFQKREGPNSVITGLTITKGLAPRMPREPPCGGGILCFSCPMISNCIFITNSATGAPDAAGGAIYNSGGNPTITNCVFKNNTAIGSNLSRGGAIYSFGSPTPIRADPIITNCIFTENSVGGGLTSYGGALYNENSALTLTKCTFIYNWAGSAGGGIYIKNSSGTLTGCTFNGNEATVSGGGICNDSRSNPILTDCSFIGNSAATGGGMHNLYYSNPTLINCVFIANTATYEGAAIANWDNNFLTSLNCRFTGNFAPHYGGGIFNSNYARVQLINCTFAGNYALDGSAFACRSYWGGPCQVNAIDCIFWDVGDEIFAEQKSKVDVTYSNVQGGWQGEGNINTDPCFVDAGLWANINDLNTPADPTGPDAIWVDGDYHLKSRAGHWDTTTESWIKDLLASPCIDAGDPTSPVGLEPFPNGGIINVGSFGGTKEASKSYFGEPLCQIIVAGDINGDCKVNFIDFAFISFHWLENNKGKTWPSPWPPPPPPPKGRTCFPADTLVWVDGSLVQISKVVAGQMVGKTNCLAGATEQIEAIQEHEGTFQCRDIALESGSTISVVDSHCFLLDSGRWLAAQNLKAGLKLKSLNDPVSIKSITLRAAPFVGKVYNLKIRNCDQYFVGKDGVIVRDY